MRMSKKLIISAIWSISLTAGISLGQDFNVSAQDPNLASTQNDTNYAEGAYNSCTDANCNGPHNPAQLLDVTAVDKAEDSNSKDQVR